MSSLRAARFVLLVISVTIVIDFHNAEHKELPVIKISSDEGKEDCL